MGTAPIVVTSPATSRAAPQLDEEQRRAVAGDGGSQLVVGGPGSGKSLVLTESLAVRLADGWPAESLLGLAGTAAAARRWRTEVVARTGSEAPMITTLHSLALRLVGWDAERRGAELPRLLTHADQLELIGGVLSGTSAASWPVVLQAAAKTRSFAEQVRDFIARAALCGHTPQTLSKQPEAPAVWAPLASVWRRYLKVKSLAGAIDYADLLVRAAGAAREQGHPWRLICVDDYAELDRQQLRLLRALVGPGCALLAVADPDCVVHRFRGAAQEAVTRFDELFPDPQPPIVLTGRYRFGPQVEQARLALLDSVPVSGLPARVVRAHRTAGRPRGAASLDVLGYPDGLAEGAAVADIVRRYALSGAAESGRPRWGDVAILVRSSAQLVAIEQALLSAGVPVAGAEVGARLADEPVVALLRTGLELAARMAGLDVAEPPAHRITQLLTSPMAGADPVALRRLVLQLRTGELARAAAEGRLAASAGQLVLSAVVDPGPVLGIDPGRYPAVRAILALHSRIAAAARLIAEGADADQPLWTLWSDRPAGPGSWAARLRAVAVAGGPGSASAHRELDAAMALFEQVRRSQARGGGQRVADLLGELPAMRWPAARFGAHAQRNAVTLTTAHRAMGRQWPLVIVAGVQEGVWPAAGGGVGLLGQELLLDPQTTPVAERAAAVADERRAFHLACTRASEHLVVTAVEASDRDPTGARPSRFLAELGVPLRGGRTGQQRRLTPASLIATLRRAALAADESSGAAVAALAGLRGDPGFPQADPDAWWGMVRRTRAAQPLVSGEGPVTLTVTGLTELAACPWRWFVTRSLHAQAGGSAASGIGQLVHRVHQAWVDDEIGRDLESAQALVERIWPALPFEADWQAQRRRNEVEQALARLLSWLEDNRDRVAFAEQAFSVEVASGSGEPVVLIGKADIGVRGQDAGLAILDIKTAKTPPPGASVQRHLQLAGYQAAVGAGALGEGGPSRPAGAGLLMASVSDGVAGTGPKVLWQPPLDLSEGANHWFVQTLTTAVGRLRDERFPAIESAACRTCPVRQLCPAKNAAAEGGSSC